MDRATGEVACRYSTRDSPCVLSVGKPCVDLGYETLWPAHDETPYFTAPDGKGVEPSVDNCLPFLDPNAVLIAPATNSNAPVEHDHTVEGSAIDDVGARATPDEPATTMHESAWDRTDGRSLRSEGSPATQAAKRRRCARRRQGWWRRSWPMT